MDGSEGPTDSGRHTLGPHVVGQRVVVRRVLRGETGPSGGPALTDVLGICTGWAGGLVTVERDDGTTVTIATADIVSGKPVPPRPSHRLRGTPAEHQARVPTLWPGVTVDRLGDWLLLADPTSAEHDAVFAFGDPGLPLTEAVAGVGRQRARVQAGSAADAAFLEAGWTAEAGDRLFLVAGLSRVHRALRGVDPEGEVETDGDLLTVTSPSGRVRAGVVGDWLGISDLWVDPGRRRRGHARALLAGVVERGAERGATAVWLCVPETDAPAVALCQSLGFATHHRYRQLARFSVEEVETIAAGLFVPREVRRLGGWLLRYAGGPNRRPNSVLPVGDPGVPLDEALAAVAGFYAAHDRSPCVQVVVGSPVHRALEDRGWLPLLADEADTEVLLGDVATVGRRLAGVDTAAVRHDDHVSRGWLVGNEAALADFAVVGQTLALPDAVFAAVHEDGRQVARARASLHRGWALVADLTVQPERRRHGLARVVMADLARWAADHGAGVMLLQVLADNEPAQRLYASLGFGRHHAYRYLVPA